MIGGLEALCYEARLRAGLVQPGEENNVFRTEQAGEGKGELLCSVGSPREACPEQHQGHL